MFFFKVNVPVGVTPEGLCVYWRPGESLIWETSGCSLVASESDINKTTCECDHLTTFASLMDPYAPTVSEFGIHLLSIHFSRGRREETRREKEVIGFFSDFFPLTSPSNELVCVLEIEREHVETAN